MRLYAKVTSERASKGQGGNERIELNIFDANQTKIIEGSLIPTDEGIEVYVTTLTEGEANQCIDTIIQYPQSKPANYNKVKNQKGDICRHCGKQHKNAICGGGLR